MAKKFMQTVLTSDVQRAQHTYFGRHQTVVAGTELDSLTSDEIAFIAARDSFYMAAVIWRQIIGWHCFLWITRIARD